MILTNRLFERQEPSKEAKSIYIFCEGIKREYQYFEYFKELDSRINVEIHKLHPHDDNSPIGLLNIAKESIIRSKENPNPKFTFQKNDEVWIVIDTDKDKRESRKPQIEELYKFCSEEKGWSVAQSNPCFEVWLSYHVSEDKLEFKGDDKCSKWKNKVNSLISGGFDPRRHPIYIEAAVTNSKNNFKSDHGIPYKGCTEVYLLGDIINRILKEKIDRALKKLDGGN